MRRPTRRQLLGGFLPSLSLSVLVSARPSRVLLAEAGEAFRLESPAFAHGERIPARYTCEGEDISPPLHWFGTPAGTRSLALLCDDPDAPMGTWWHWGVYDIRPGVPGLPEGYPTDARVGETRQAINDFGRHGYGGPCPPPGHGTHHYRFRLLALEVDSLELSPGISCPRLEEAARGHLVAETELIGTYSR